MSAPELSRPIKARSLPPAPVEIVASEAECAALAERFGILAVRSLSATVDFEPKGDAVLATGRMEARIVQECAVSGDDLESTITEDIQLRFVPAREHPAGEEEVELQEEDLDEIEYEGETFDAGEAVAQTLGLAIDPYATGPDADRVRKEKGLADEETPSGPFAALAGLKKD